MKSLIKFLTKDRDFINSVCGMSKSCSGGSGDTGNLEQVTTAGNSTPNAIQVTGANNLSISEDSAFMVKGGDNAQFGGLFNGATTLGLLSFYDDGTFSLGNNQGYFLSSKGINTPFEFLDTDSLARVSGADGSEPHDFVNLQQVQPVVDHPYKGGHASFIADGNETVFDIVHNAGFIPSYFTLTTTTPITQNQLNRQISFPDENTMRIEFNNAPLIGEDTDYVYIVYK